MPGVCKRCRMTSGEQTSNLPRLIKTSRIQGHMNPFIKSVLCNYVTLPALTIFVFCYRQFFGNGMDLRQEKCELWGDIYRHFVGNSDSNRENYITREN